MTNSIYHEWTPLPKWMTFEEYELQQAQIALSMGRDREELIIAVEDYVESIIGGYPNKNIWYN